MKSSICLCCLAVLSANAATPVRLMPFLTRDAVVREPAETFTLTNAATPLVIIAGKDSPGPRQRFENGQINEAGRKLSSFIEKITGRPVKMVSSVKAAKPGANRIFVGAAEANPLEAFPELKKADAHGFVIAARGNDLHLVGASGTGTLNAAWFFLMNYAGVRLVLPHELGEIVPKHESLTLPRDLYVLNAAPDFLLRTWSGTAGFTPAAWLADAAGTERFEYHHNAYKIYDPAKYGVSHPEYYAVREGRPFVPGPGETESWQANFSEPAAASRAVEYADELFSARPDLKSVSLTVNDGLGYSETDMKQGRLLPNGDVSISDPYGRYVNRVAEGIKARWPDKFVAFTPYNLTKAAPSFPLADNVVVFLFKEPAATFGDWQGKARHLGAYQWLYGMGWMVPNHWPHAMQDNLRWLRAHGGLAYKGEAYPAWIHDGPKLWVFNNLLWNTEVDVDALLCDYYEHTYGVEAAPAIARYFAQAEKMYERRRAPGEYNFASVRPEEKQFEHATEEDFQVMRAALAAARATVKGEGNEARLALLEKAFTWVDLRWRQQAILLGLLDAKVKGETEATTLLASLKEFHKLEGEVARHYKANIATEPEYCVYSDGGKGSSKPPHPGANPEFHWRRLDEAIEHACATISQDLLTRMDKAGAAEWWLKKSEAQAELRPYSESQRLSLLRPGEPLKNLLTNGSFEAAADASAAKDWPAYHNRMINAKVWRDTTQAHSGQASLSARGLTDVSGVIRQLSVPNHARYRLTFWYKTTAQVRHIELNVANGPRLGEYLPPAEQWTRVERTLVVDRPGAADKASLGFYLALRHGGSEQSQAWFDDVSLEMLAPEGVEVAVR